MTTPTAATDPVLAQDSGAPVDQLPGVVDDAGEVLPGEDAGGGGGGPAPSPVDPGDCTSNPLGAEAVDGATLKKLAQGAFLDGPVWDEAGGVLVYSEVNAQQIVRIGAEGGTAKMVRWTGAGTSLPIGNAITGGFIFTAQATTTGTGAILRTNLDGTDPQSFPTPNINSPNDIVASSKGFLYFTDPGFQAATAAPSTGIYRMSTTGEIATIDRFEAAGTNPGARADGIALSKDEKTLFVGFYDAKRIAKYTLDEAGMASTPTDVAFKPIDSPTGIAVDMAGNLWVAESGTGMNGRVEVVAPDGKKWGEITFADARATGVAFGGADAKTVFITTERDTALGTLYSTTSPCAGVR